MVSTPKITGSSRIESAFEESDQRYYYVPCPYCGELQTLKFAQVRWLRGEPQNAKYVCEHCAGEIENHQKHWMLPRGNWKAKSPGPGKAAGFHLSSLYSPVGWFSWGDAAQMFVDAQKNSALLQVFVNTVAGETWSLKGDAPDWQWLYDRREDYPVGTVPHGGLLLTAGVDVQKDRIELEVVAWGRGKESWSVDYEVLEGTTSQGAVWDKLTAHLAKQYPTKSGAAIPITKVAIDSGYATPEVYDWSRRHGGTRVVVIKGDSRAAGAVNQPAPVDVGPRGKHLRMGVRVWPVNSSMIKEELFRWLKLDRPTDESGAPHPPGYCHFPKYGEEYFKQLTAEQLVPRVIKGYSRPEWQKTRDRNEALDVRVYARAAAAIHGIDRFDENTWRRLEAWIATLGPAGSPRPAIPQRRPPLRMRLNWPSRI